MAASGQNQYKPDEKGNVYDNKGSDNPLSGSSLNKQESGVTGKSSSSNGSSGSGDADGSTKQASAGSLNKSESSGGFYKKSSSALRQGLKAGAGGEVSAAKTFATAITGFFANHKKGTAAGGGVIGIFVFLAIFGAGFFVTHELVTIEKTLVKYEFKVEEHFEKKVASKLMQKIVCIRVKTCGSGTDPDEPDPALENAGPTAAAEAVAVADGEQLTVDMDTFPITDPAVISGLSDAGIKVVLNKDGSFGGFENNDDKNVTDDVVNDSFVANDVEAGTQEWNIGQVESFVPTMTEESGSTFNPSTAAEPLDNDKTMVADIEDGATETELVAAAETSDSNNPTDSSNNTAALKQDASDGQAATGETEKILTQADADEKNGDTPTEVLDDVSSDTLNLGTPLLANTAVQDVCSVDKLASGASKSRVPKIETLLIRHGTLLISLADELKAGALSGGVVNKVMSLLNGNSSAQPTTNPATHVTTPSPDVQPFSSSAAWQSASGGTGGVPIDNSSLPTANAGTGIVNEVNGGLSDTKVGPILCDVENSKIGSIFGTLLNGAGLFVGGLSLGWGEAAIAAGTISFQFTLQHVIIPAILKYFTPIGLDGLENSTQWLNNSDAGLNLASNNYARSVGANPVTNTTAGQIADEATQEQDVAESHLPWVDRTLALSNSESLASRLLTHVPIGLASTINEAVNYLMTIPTTLVHDLSTIMDSRAFAATTPPTPGVVYGITQYAFTDNELGKYDPIANEQYLFTNLVTFNGKTTQRIANLGNPNTAAVNTSGDELDSSGNLQTSDLLHCYLDSYSDLQEVTKLGTGIDTNCYVPGGYNLGDYDYTTNPPLDASGQDAALDSTIVNIYCTALGAPPTPGDKYYSPGWYDSKGVWHNGCAIVMPPQVNDDIGHFRQYILDVHVMKDYMSLTTSQ